MNINWGFAAVGGAAAVGGLACLWGWTRYRAEFALMAATETSRAADIATTAPGTLVEVKGTIRCDAPLTGEFSGRPCVFSRSVVEHGETRWEDGKRKTRYVTERSTERHAPFYVEDDSGRVLVHGQDASVDAQQVFHGSGNTTADNLVSAATSLAGSDSNDRRLRESVLSPGQLVYVLGTVRQDGTIGAAPEGAAVRNFIITYETEEQRSRSSRTMSITMIVLAALLLAGAAWAFWAMFKYA
jgi:hypothetical protein